MRAMSSRLVTTSLLLLGACGGPEKMSGFTDADARALVGVEVPTDACAVRTGKLVLEVERVVIREYPNAIPVELRVAGTPELPKLPLILLWIRGERQTGRPPEVDLSLLAAPEDFLSGDRVRFFEGKRLLERPLRSLSGRTLELRLAENDRTMTPRWAEIGHMLAGGASGAASAVGVSAPTSVIDVAIDLVRKIDEDDLILIWSTPVEELAATLAPLARIHLATPRDVVDAAGQKAPSAELDLLAYVEPEPGCP